MTMNATNIGAKKVEIIKPMLKEYLIIFGVAAIVSYLTVPVIWAKKIYLFHTSLELLCIFIAASTFLIIWVTFQKPIIRHSLLGYGFLSVAIFDLFHCYYYIAMRLYGEGYRDIPTRYWILGRLIEAIILITFSKGLTEIKLNKWIALFTFSITSIAAALAILYFPGIMPVMVTDEGPTAFKIAMEYIIMAFLAISLFNIKGKINDENAISNKYIFMTLLFFIPSEFFFTIYKSITGFHNMFGHILKVASYYYLYKAVFASSIEYPYMKLEETNCRVEEISAAMNETLDALPIGIVKYESDSTIKYINKRFVEIFACDRSSLYGITAEQLKNTFLCYDKTDRNIFQMTYESGQEQKNLIRTYKNAKDERIKISLTSKCLTNGALAYFSEVKSEQGIKDFNLQTQTILNAVINNILLIDKNKRIILTNNAFQKCFEVESSELIGMHISEFIKRVGDVDQEPFSALFRGEDIENPYEISVTSFRGNHRELLNHIAPIKDVDNEIIGGISVSTDITEMKKQQHSMQQQEKLAMIGQMAAGIVHEIKNPLATIKGLSQLILVKAKVDKVKEYSEVIISAIDDVTKVVNEFLNFAKPKPTLKVRTSINRIVESMHLLTETQCYIKNIKVQFHYSTCPMEITADEFKIKQVILNITENAIAALEHTELPEISICTYYNTDASEGVIQVSDNGMGMSQEILSKLGDPFFTTKEKGTGLGLGISYQIMKEHGGRIEADSIEGAGTTFRIIFTQIEDLI